MNKSWKFGLNLIPFEEYHYQEPLHDLNNDHRLVFNSALIETRSFSSSVKQLLSYECPGPVKHTFQPTIYQNIEKEFSYKLKAFKMYKSEVMKFPHLRSIEIIENLAIQRGVECSLKKGWSLSTNKKYHRFKKINSDTVFYYWFIQLCSMSVNCLFFFYVLHLS